MEAVPYEPHAHPDRLAVWKAIAAHVLAFLLTFGFFAIVFVALVGYADIKDPTTAQFIGTVTGYAISKLDRPMAFYFGARRDDKKDGNSNGPEREHR